MKKILFLFVLLPIMVVGQTQTENYIKTTNYKVPTTSRIPTPTIIQANQNITYFDGLGRPIQQVAHQQSGSGKDIVTPMEYDDLGRQPINYLPYVPNVTASLDYKTTALAEVLTYYATGNANLEATTNPFSKKLFDGSPLNRVLQQASPGNDWAMPLNHTIKFDYLTNVVNEVKLFTATASTTNYATDGFYAPTLSQTINYAASQLYKMITKDENWVSGSNHTTEEFKNKEGQVVLKRAYESGIKHDTYYIYDQYGNLTFVLPPLVDTSNAISQTILDGLCYQYKYDRYNRMVEKKLPGKQWEFIVYDKLDRVVATGPAFSPFSDATQIGIVGWLITKYDVFNRPVYTGWEQSSTITNAGRLAKQNDQNNLTTANYETKSTAETIDDISVNYTNKVAPTTFKLLTVNYYDDYNFPKAPSPVPTTVLTDGSQAVHYNNTLKPLGLPTGSWVRVLQTTTEINSETSYILYDIKSRPIQTKIQIYFDGTPAYKITDAKLDFSGKLLLSESRFKHFSPVTEATTNLLITETFTYSPQDRLLTHTHQINTNTPQLLAANTYDELGQLISKDVGNTTTTPLQKVDYTYNIRGWLTGINNDPTNNLILNTVEKDLFALKINYNTTENCTNYTGISLYNGNISETYWRTASDNVVRKYGYIYDNLSRLRDAIYQKPGLTPAQTLVTNAYDENITYDKNGNITSLKRKGNGDPQIGAMLIDDLTYDYKSTSSNQLAKVTDWSGNLVQGFREPASTTGDDYTFDANGNLKSDKNKNIPNIIYNHLNLPTKITFGTISTIEYLYTANGKKIEKKIVTQGAGTISTKYLEGFQYIYDVLQFFPTVEGYVKNTAGIFSYVFNYTDHLGNVRISYQDKNNSGIIDTGEIVEENNYYPFGFKHNGYNSNNTQPKYKYKYNGKEFQEELSLNLYDYGARNYDPAIGRWMNIDPLAEKSRRFSPYTYALNNPVFFIDPDGMEATENDDWIVHENSKGETAVTYQQGVETKEQAETANYQGVSQVIKSGTISGTSPDGSAYSYHLNDNGTVTNSAGQTTNEGFSTPNGTYVSENPIARVDMAIGGTVNVVMGAVGFAGSMATTATGVGAVPGVAGMTLSTGEIGIGIGQIANSFQKNVDGDLQNFNTLPGLAAARSGNPNATYIDGVAGFATGTITGGNFRSMLDAVQPNASSSAILGGVDSYMDSKSLWDSANQKK